MVLDGIQPVRNDLKVSRSLITGDHMVKSSKIKLFKLTPSNF